MRRPDGIADGHDLLRIATEQIDVFADPEDRRRDIPGAARPRVCRRQPIGHSHADHAVAGGKAHRRILQRAREIGNAVLTDESLPGHEQQHGTRHRALGRAGRDIQYILIVLAIFQAAGERHALA